MNRKTKLKRDWYKKMQVEKGMDDTQLLGGIWERLDEKGYVDQAIADPTESPLEVLTSDAEPFIEGAEIQARHSAWFPSTSEQGQREEREEREGITPLLDDLESERVVAFEEYLASIAASDARVRRFRERVLKGELLTPEQVQTVVNSPATQVFSRRQLDNWGIPLVDHLAELKEIEERRVAGRIGCRFTVRVEPPGIERTINRRVRELLVVGESGHVESITVGDRSVMGELAELADKLFADYPWESKGEIAHFVLTGAVPNVPPVRMHYMSKRKLNLEGVGGFRYGWITLEVAPWVSAKTVESAFRQAKGQVVGKRKYRRLEEKSLKMIRFVASYDEPPKGRQLLEAWNATEWVDENPTWYYDPDKRSESSRFWRDYHRARRALAYEKRRRPDDH